MKTLLITVIAVSGFIVALGYLLKLYTANKNKKNDK